MLLPSGHVCSVLPKNLPPAVNAQHDVFQFRIQTAGMSSALPYFVLMCTTLGASSAVDVLRQRKVWYPAHLCG
jgi:hypothetical protein